MEMEKLRIYLCKNAFFNGSACFRVKLKALVAAGHGDVITPVPFYQWQEEEAEAGIYHINLNGAVSAAAVAYHSLIKIKFHFFI